MKKLHDRLPTTLPCPICGNAPIRTKDDEWDDWGRWIDRTLYKISCCGIETSLQGLPILAINQWNIKVKATGGIK